MTVAAVVTVAFTVIWIWDKAEALSPVDLPSANGTPLETITPSARPTVTPPPQGRFVDGFMVAWNNDRMLGMPQPPWEAGYDPRPGLYGSIAMQMIVHEKYDGTNSWGNIMAFGGIGKGVPYNSSPAGMKLAAQHVGARMVSGLYDASTVPIKGSVKHRTLTVGGHRAHEIVARIPVSRPKLKETNSVIAIVVIDRGDGTAMASVGAFAGSTTGWFLYWRNQVQKIQINP
jgi:hypothetical protein